MGKIVGFEIGDHSVKLAYFAGNELKKAVCAELPDAMVSHGRILSMDAMADFLRDTARANGIPRAGAAVSLSLADAYTRDVTMPAMTEQQLSYNLPFEFHDFLTEEKSKYFFDYSVREVRKDPAGIPVEMDLFACAMLKERVEAYRAMFRRAGFKLKVLTPLECAYGALMAEHIRRTGAPEIGRCVVNLGHRVTRMHFLQGGECVGVREIDMGLADLDRIIADKLDVEIHVAQFQRRTGNGLRQGILQPSGGGDHEGRQFLPLQQPGPGIEGAVSLRRRRSHHGPAGDRGRHGEPDGPGRRGAVGRGDAPGRGAVAVSAGHRQRL